LFTIGATFSKRLSTMLMALIRTKLMALIREDGRITLEVYTLLRKASHDEGG
jgi:hypothetical protein